MYRSPVFSADSRRIYALQGSSVVEIDAARPETSREIRWPDVDSPRLLLGPGGTQSAAIAVLTMGSRVIALMPSDGTTEVLAEALPPRDVASLSRQLGTCGVWVVYEGEQKGAGLNMRTDVFIRESTARIGKPLTAEWPGSVHGQPAFSNDCGRVVFVSDEK